ncbi:MAG: hypothetical protein NDI61_11685 [Bdellovibrionaceae bacterium]|nr:hypothetical protein [Pseudobdellovibrionaceae bacterium]
MNRRIVKVGAVLIVALLVIAFQNCSAPMQFQSIEGLGSGLPDFGFGISGGTGGTGNGGTYDGKPTTFLRYLPGFACLDAAGNGVAKAQIVQTNTNYMYTEKMTGVCQDFSVGLLADQIDRSVLQGEFIGYRGSIFKRFEAVPQGIPDHLVEVSCRDRNSADGLEVVTHYNTVAREGMARIYKGVAGGVTLIPDFGVSRVLTSADVEYRSVGFELHVELLVPSSEPYRFRGRLSWVDGGATISREMHCLRGGALDAAVWPGREVLQKAASVADTSWISDEWLVSADSLLLNQVSAKLNFKTMEMAVHRDPALYEVSGMRLTPRTALPDGSFLSNYSKQLFLPVQPFGQGVMRPSALDPGLDLDQMEHGILLWNASPMNSGTGILSFQSMDPKQTNPFANSGYARLSQVMTTASFSDEQVIILKRPEWTRRLSSAALVSSGKKMCVLGHSRTENLLVSVSCPDFQVVAGPNAEARMFSESGDPIGSVMPLRFEPGWSFMNRIESVLDGVLVMTGTNFYASGTDRAQILLRLRDGISTTLPVDVRVEAVSADQMWVLARNLLTGRRAVYPISSQNSVSNFEIPLESKGAALDPVGSWLYMDRGDGSLVRVELGSFLSTQVCPAIRGLTSLVRASGQLSEAASEVFAISANRDSRSTEFWSVTSSGCVKRNSLAVEMPGVWTVHSQANSSPMIFSALLQNGVQNGVESEQAVFAVPMDGRPARWLNAGGLNFKNIRLIRHIEESNLLVIQEKVFYEAGWATSQTESFYLFDL